MFDIQYLIKEWLDKRAILYPRIKRVLKQGKWDRRITYWLALVFTVHFNTELILPTVSAQTDFGHAFAHFYYLRKKKLSFQCTSADFV